MRKKFLVLTLCFTIIFSSLNYKRSYAMDLVVSPSMFYTLSALTVAYGLTIPDSDALYNISREFFEWSGESISDTIDIFNSAVSIGANGVVNVGKSFLDKFNDFLTVNSFRYGDIDTNYSITCGGFPTYEGSLSGEPSLVKSFGNTYIDEDRDYYILNGVEVYHGSTFHKSLPFLGYYVLNGIVYARHVKGSVVYDRSLGGVGTWYDTSVDSWTNPFVGQYDDSVVNDNINEDGSLGLVLNPNVDSLIGKVAGDVVYDGTNANSYNGSISVPNVNDPSISVEGDMSFTDSLVDSPSIPGVGDVPSNPSLPSLPSWGSGLDFSPITQGVFTDKFPFCLAKDVRDIISVFDVPSRNLKEPVFKVPLNGEELVLDFREFKLWFDIVKFFVLIGFIISLIVLTRGIIG